jgi:hypothetical protein
MVHRMMESCSLSTEGLDGICATAVALNMAPTLGIELHISITFA